MAWENLLFNQNVPDSIEKVPMPIFWYFLEGFGDNFRKHFPDQKCQLNDHPGLRDVFRM